jgi:hypothetical protein
VNLKASILDITKPINKLSSFLKGTSKNKKTAETSSTAEELSDSIDTTDLDFLSGMSSATARIVIDKNLPDNYRDLYNIEELQNQGRYYIAKIVEPPGKVVARVLVDKLNGTVHFPKDKIKR